MSAASTLSPELVHSAISGTELQPQNHTFEGADGVKIACWIAGSGPLLIAASPGWGIGMGYMQRAFPPFTAKYTLLIVWSRGTPPSERPSDELKMGTANMAEDLEALRIFLRLETIPILLGHSHGGSIVQQYASEHAGCVGKLLLLCTSLLGSNASHAEIQKPFLDARKDHPIYKKAIPGMAKAYAATNDEEFTAGLAQLVPYYFAHPGSEAAKQWQKSVEQGSVAFWAWRTQKFADRPEVAKMPNLAAITAKTLIVLCDEDPVCTAVWANEIHAHIHGSRLVTFKDCGHMPWHEADDFWPTVFEFLGES